MHDKLGHSGEALTRNTAKYLCYEVIGRPTKYESCTAGKLKQKPINKVASADRAKYKIGEKLYIDISSVKGVSTGGNKLWVLWVDEIERKIQHQEKSDLTMTVKRFIEELKSNDNIQVNTIQCYNIGENKTFEKSLTE